MNSLNNILANAGKPMYCVPDQRLIVFLNRRLDERAVKELLNGWHRPWDSKEFIIQACKRSGIYEIEKQHAIIAEYLRTIEI